MKRYLSADDYLHDMWRLAARVMKSDWKPELIIALWRGGAPVGVSVHEFLLAAGVKTRHIAIKCSSYTGIGEQGSEIKFDCCEEVFSALRPGEKVLVIDDVFDTGRTAAAVKARLERKQVDAKIATVYFKPTKNLTSILPDYFVKELPDEWIVFPHELEGLSEEELAEKDPLLKELLK